jgi:IS30 family transposase
MAEDAKQWMDKRGVRARTGKREQCLRLMNQGMSNSEACRQVGINRRTGTRWRYGCVVDLGDGCQIYYEPIAGPVVVSNLFMSATDRLVIADGLRAGHTQKLIAKELERSPSTISREIARNRDPNSGEYRLWSARQQTAQRRCRPKQRTMASNDELRQVVEAGLDKRWSPE